MNFAINSRKLANFILDNQLVTNSYEPYHHYEYDHFGALITDVVLQSGLNYRNVVLPRVDSLLTNYPHQKSLNDFCELIEVHGLSNLINWNHHTKLDRILRLIHHFNNEIINSTSELKVHLRIRTNREQLLSLKGIGPKTVDYLLKLLDFDTVAVDRHIYTFVSMAGIEANNYHNTKRVVEYAADLINIPRSQLDKEIWKYMS
ncbi:MAG: hypothetical protein WD059_15140 [Balneolaceae bacterium]